MNTIVETTVGSTITPEAQFPVDAKVNTAGAIVSYQLQDKNGVVYATGNALSVSAVSLNSSLQLLVATASVAIPPSVPVTTKKDKYRLVWIAKTSLGSFIGSFVETLSIAPVTVEPFGVPDIVSLLTTDALVQAVLPSVCPVDVTIYNQNNVISAAVSVAPDSAQVYVGSLYKYSFLDADALGIFPSINPYSVVWKYLDMTTGETIMEDGYFYYVNPTILQAAMELQRLVNRSKNGTRLADAAIDLNICIHFLKMGMDYFNGIGQPSYLTMENAWGAVRSMWIACSEVLLLQSQYLLEAERSFNMAGQSITLDFDITQYYDTIIGQKQSYIDAYLPDLKKNIGRRGILMGDGNLNSPYNRNTGALGVTLSPVSNFYSLRFPRYRGY